MPNFTVYQPVLTDAQADLINAKGWQGSDLAKVYGTLSMPRWQEQNPGTGRLVLNAIECDIYKMTGSIQSPDCYKVFKIGNIGPEECITRREGYQMRSLSCGDIIVNEDTDECLFCAAMGWFELADDVLAKIRDACGWREVT